MYQYHAMPPKEILPLFDGMVNPSVLPEDEIRLSGQNFIVFERLKRGPATNIELHRLAGGLAIHSRISDVRQELQKYGWDIKKVKKYEGGINEYTIINPKGEIYGKENKKESQTQSQEGQT